MGRPHNLKCCGDFVLMLLPYFKWIGLAFPSDEAGNGRQVQRVGEPRFTQPEIHKEEQTRNTGIKKPHRTIAQ